MSNRQLKKIRRKTKRCQVLIEKETEISLVDSAEKNLVICNAGLSTGLRSECIFNEITDSACISAIIMLPGKSYCFLSCPTTDDAQKIFNQLHGKSKLGQNDGIIYMSFCKDVPKVEDFGIVEKPPEGLIILKDFITHEEERALLHLINWKSERGLTERELKNRQVKHFGYEFIYGSNNVDPEHPLEVGIPPECTFLWKRLRTERPDIDWPTPDQLTVNKYEPGQGIPAHCDTHSAFVGPIVSLSLGSDIVMEFKNSTGRTYRAFLPARSLLLMTDESRYNWTHTITPRTMDIVSGLTENALLTILNRSTRVSYTFRKLRRAECDCKYPYFCDTKKKESEYKDKSVELSRMATKVEEENVHKIYNEIAQHFSETRHSPWPRVTEFIENLPTASILLDIGCGNGKYLLIRNDIIKIGCDRSEVLLQVCLQRQLNTFQCDCLVLPFRDESANACISIAVIHHLASEERRIQAVKEMARVLQKSGQGLIYVWAKNQEADSKKSSYLRQNKKLSKNNLVDEGESRSKDENLPLPVHTNRTQFRHRDILVPWKLKDGTDNSKTFFRYYHVFEEGELIDLCLKVESIKIIQSYYDQGNWCIIFEKI